MRSRTKRALLMIASLGLLLIGGAAYVALAAPAKPGITVQISPASQSVPLGSAVNYTVTLTSTGNFVGSVALTTSGLPSGASASFSPNPVSVASDATATSALTVTTTRNSTVGSYTFTVTGSSGSGKSKVTGSVTAGLTVNYPVSSSLSMTATPSSVTMAPGATAVYTVQLTRTNLSGPVTFSVSKGLPSGSTATYSPNPTTGNSSTLQITTNATTATGTYQLYLVASGKGDDGTGTKYAYANVQLVLTKTGKAFTISGNLPGLLSPGASQPLNLTLSNPNSSALSITNLTVTVQSVTKSTSAVGTCSTADYAVTQYSGPYPLSVPKNGSASFASLNVPQSQWPQVRMLDTASNQDGCKGATLTLAYSGSGQGN